MKATKADFDTTIALHPTAAEELVPDTPAEQKWRAENKASAYEPARKIRKRSFTTAAFQMRVRQHDAGLTSMPRAPCIEYFNQVSYHGRSVLDWSFRNLIKDNFALRLYTRVARLGSFSAAARECGLSQSQASRIVAELEAELGTRLLSRTTRAVVPTEAGGEFLARVEPILAALDEAEHSVREGGELRGLVRMSMPTSFGIRDVIPRLASFAERHPALHIQLQMGDRRHDVVRDAVDVAIRLGSLADAAGTAKRIATIPRVVVASPDYLARHGAPDTPEDLGRHRIIGGTSAAVPSAWRFERDGQESAIKLEPHFSTDENEGAIAAAVAGFGITSTSGWACRRELENGALACVLTKWALAGIPVHAYFPMGRATRAAARAIIDHLVANFEQGPPAEPI